MRFLKRLLSRRSKPQNKKQEPNRKEAAVPKVARPVEVRDPHTTPVRQKVKQIVLGLDFGTSGTKVVLRDLWSNRAEPVMFDGASRSPAGFILPSSIRIENGRLYFADTAEDHHRTGQLFRGFKMCMACEIGLNVCQISRCPNKPISEGRFQVIEPAEKVVISGKDLTLWYLAYVQGRVAEILRSRYANDAELKIWTNVGAPIDQEFAASQGGVYPNSVFVPVPGWHHPQWGFS